MFSGIAQYTGAVIAVRLFEELHPATVAVFRVLLGAVPILIISWRSQRRWTSADLRAAAVFGVATATMNLFFYLAIDRLPLGKSVVIEFLGPVAIAAWFTRSPRNTPPGVFFIFCASSFWAFYIVLGRRVARLDRGLSGLGVGLVIGGLAILPFGAPDALQVLTTPRLLGLCALVGLLSSAIGYAIDQIVLRRIPMRRFALLLALLPVTAMVVGFIALDQRPSVADLIGAAMVICGVLIQDRDELPAPVE
ncbi:MAG: hypothetical protein RLZ14_812 [Actinomycetota bacterium]